MCSRYARAFSVSTTGCLVCSVRCCVVLCCAVIKKVVSVRAIQNIYESTMYYCERDAMQNLRITFTLLLTGWRLGMAMALPKRWVASRRTSGTLGPSRKWWWKSSGRVSVRRVPAGTDRISKLARGGACWACWAAAAIVCLFFGSFGGKSSLVLVYVAGRRGMLRPSTYLSEDTLEK